MEKEVAENISRQTPVLLDGQKLVLFTEPTRLSETAFKMGAHYFGQIVEHPSGNGVTAYIVGKKHKEFPKLFADYARSLTQMLSSKFNEDAISFKIASEKKGTSCFIVSSLKDPNARIPNVTVQEFSQRVLDLFNEKEIDKLPDFDK